MLLFLSTNPPKLMSPLFLNLKLHKKKHKTTTHVSSETTQLFNYEPPLKTQKLRSSSLKIAIIGFSKFGQFFSKTFLSHDHTLLVHSCTDYSDLATSLGIQFFLDANDLFEHHPDVVLLSTSIFSTKQALLSLPLQRLNHSTLFVDVLPIKEFPRNLFIKQLPPEFDILCTHPMFGLECEKNSWAGSPLVYDKVRILDESQRHARCESFLNIFRSEGCRMVEMSCAEHDKYASGSQFVMHVMGRVLQRFGLESSPINTKGFESLFDLVQNTRGDSFDLCHGLFTYNKHVMEQLERLDLAFKEVKKALFGQLNQVHGKQWTGDSEEKRFMEYKLLDYREYASKSGEST